jgi:orotate phosphoribosyltransferase
VSDREELLAGIKAKGIVRGDFVLSSGQRASSYVDLRRVTLDGRLAPLVGRVLGRRVLALEDTSTTGDSVLTAVEALEAAGAEVAGVAVIVDRGARQKILDRGLPYIAVYELAELGL